MAAAEGSALTGVAWSVSPEAAPAGWTVITATVEGTPANLGKGFGNKGGGYLCVSTGGAQASPGSVVTDVQVLSDRTPHPPGYIRVPEFPESRAAASRKKRVYVKLLPAGAAETAVTDLRVSGKSRTLPGYLRIGEMGSFAIWCKKAPFSRPMAPPSPTPRPPSPPLHPPQRQLPPEPPNRSLTSSKRESPYDASGIYGLSAMDGVPFTLHPKFEAKLNSGTNALLADLSVKSLADIDREYNYTFVVERTAAARLPPGVS
ncbi:multivesicular body subunit 12A isoform X2 [Patagioenas fasciata]|uniref:multivesicular body subunit 12A isoform X2 n=1 Tax=Patagioenas fasciata TaxID=372321 RepID=UPI003A9986B8